MKTTSIILAGALFLSTFIATAGAQSNFDLPADLRQYYAVTDPSPALAGAMDMRDREWNSAPLGFTDALFVDRASQAYGTYAARPTGRFAIGETIRVYAEPVGYSYGRDGKSFLIDLATDIEVRIPSGQVILTQRDFARIRARTGKPITEFSANLALSFDGLKPGSYVLQITFRDLNSTKTADFTLPFVIDVQQ
jgi:hypothetical protein